MDSFGIPSSFVDAWWKSLGGKQNEKNEINLHRWVMILCLAAFLAAVVGGYLYYTALKKEALEDAHEEVGQDLKVTAGYIDSDIAWYLKILSTLAGTDAFGRFLALPGTTGLSATNRELDDFNSTLMTEASFLIDRSGMTLASSNRELYASLEKKLAQVKQLSGLLPICANCKKIRDDKSYWNQIESYIHTHSEAEFSHGLCPECAKKLYPDLKVDDDL